MNVLITILTIVDVMIALLLIAVILVQQSKDGGFGGAPFGGAGEAVFGGQAADHLTKFTVILTTLFFVVTLTLAIITGRRTGGELSVAEDVPTEITAPADEQGKDKKKENALEELAGEKPPVKVPVKKSEKIAVPVTEDKKQ